ncbi:Imm49 family immunity protein [Amphibiibacter pelophylacis]|uniref:Imm49 family immunity protein n=1 Tax=Amphibiibacter pelophylacis TaxID=1799477 RepID=A0ACC6NZI1_9BURK
MNLKNYTESKARGLTSLLKRMTPEQLDVFEERNVLLATGQGSREGCLRTLSSDCKVRSMLAYFKEKNQRSLKQWAFLSAKARIALIHETREFYLFEDLLWPLISDNHEAIEWCRQFDLLYELPEKVTKFDKNDEKSWMFNQYQSWLALNARWDELGERSERILSMENQITKDRSGLIDHRFYLALAAGDSSAMKAVLLEMVTPAVRRKRYLQQSGITWDLIDSYATIFAKLAWRAGYELELDTPWIPKEWLPVNPLPNYDEPWPFMRDFDIWQPFCEPYAHLSPKRPDSI